MDSVDYVETGFVSAWMNSGESPRNPYANGYGRKIPTSYFVLCADRRARRVYAMQYGNAGSCYIMRDGKESFLRDYHCPSASELKGDGWNRVTYVDDIAKFS